jgi:hypothetical protein
MLNRTSNLSFSRFYSSQATIQAYLTAYIGVSGVGDTKRLRLSAKIKNIEGIIGAEGLASRQAHNSDFHLLPFLPGWHSGT